MPGRTNWPGYLRRYHDSHPGITEELLRRCTSDPYAWLLEPVKAGGARVLDLACGSAPTHPHLAEARYLGVDASVGELTTAATQHRGPLLRADASRLPLPDGSIEVVICSMALQILTPLSAVLTELARVLAPGGRLVAMIPVSRPLSRGDQIRYSQLLWQLRRPRLGYANAGVPGLLRRAGWTVQQSQARRFAYPIRDRADAQLLADAFYLPHTPPQRHAAAVERVGGWVGRDLGIPLLRLVATPPAPPHPGSSVRRSAHAESGL